MEHAWEQEKPIKDYGQLILIEKGGWVDHCKTLYQPTSKQKTTGRETASNLPLTNNITQEEVEETILKLKNKKAPGVDEIIVDDIIKNIKSLNIELNNRISQINCFADNIALTENNENDFHNIIPNIYVVLYCLSDL